MSETNYSSFFFSCELFGNYYKFFQDYFSFVQHFSNIFHKEDGVYSLDLWGLMWALILEEKWKGEKSFCALVGKRKILKNKQWKIITIYSELWSRCTELFLVADFSGPVAGFFVAGFQITLLKNDSMFQKHRFYHQRMMILLSSDFPCQIGRKKNFGKIFC